MVRQLTRETTELPAYQVERRQRILDAAKKLLRVSDYDSIQIRDVASTANVALGTLYRYFSSKEHLYANVVYDWGVPFNSADQGWAQGLRTTERVARRLKQALAAFERQPNFYKAILMLRTSSDPEVRDLMEQLVLVLEEPFHADFSTLSPDEAADVTAMVWAVLMDLVSRVLAGNKTVPEATRVLDRFVAMIGLRLEQAEAERR
ncbi:helix-turn-helix domain-containing protein [Arthrobacter sp. zg-Y820]|uniref:TetR/AcrR family transcriptional regulator n=1 Tax=unclassified Arthrobacter TaxID=235627 RepID=UPI001E2CCF42|nr:MULTISPECIES: TetR/AcrR family transcriptional regulator [unclassified Arthrobacter]MCC9195576.1 TetR family transcriptional regulator [Arthrobacter sp. zg-Y820]MDK1278435.1 helix-turn-helix domain-containing protein [Arthrobacter sp. zg.Y820]WIB09125.1 helix-turn-helix domain-containing protein [Arthrobacter sp. zg-Y820]